MRFMQDMEEFLLRHALRIILTASHGEIFNAYEVANVGKIAEFEQQARNSY